jgi:hypothetical protein
MKKRFHSLTIVMSIILLIAFACSKEDVISPIQPGNPTFPIPDPQPTPPPNPQPTPPPNPQPTPPPSDHKVPKARAGNDTTVYVPFSAHVLNGSSSTGSIVSYNWRMIKSPSSLGVINYGVQYTSKIFVDQLVDIGDYDFELTVTDSYGLESKDMVKVIVSRPNCISIDKEVIIKDLQWIQPWYTQLSITDLFSYLPPNSYIKNFYIKRDGSNKWELIEPYYTKNSDNYSGKYTWEYVNYFDSNTWVLQIYPKSSFIGDTPDVKIEYCN